MDVRLAPVRPAEYDAYFEMMRAYMRELDEFDPEGAEPGDFMDRRRERILEELDERELLWIVADGRRAGFVLVRDDEHWLSTERRIAVISEFYVLPELRRRGVGRLAVERLLARERVRGTWEVEADILRDNEPALAFWRSLGFAVRMYQTARRP